MSRRRCLAAALAAVGACALLAATALAEAIQEGTLRISVSAQVKPFKLPRRDPAPIAVFIAGHIAEKDGSTPPQLQAMKVKINRHGELNSAGLPICRLTQIQPASAQQALNHCGDALVASGHFWASIVLPEARPYHTTGRLLAFNGVIGAKPALFAHIYTTQPFPASFVVTFRVRQIDDGHYGTELSTSLPQTLGDWGYVNRIKMTLQRVYHRNGKSYSYMRASCPAPAGAKTVSYPLAETSFFFAQRKPVRMTIVKPCRVSE